MSNYESMTRRIFVNALIEAGYDGLWNSAHECGCTVDDITPCDSAPWLCEPGHNDENLARENNVDAWICPGSKGESE